MTKTSHSEEWQLQAKLVKDVTVYIKHYMANVVPLPQLRHYNTQGMLKVANSLLSVFSLLTTEDKNTTKSELPVKLKFAIHVGF